jgi:hypothetical protein
MGGHTLNQGDTEYVFLTIFISWNKVAEGVRIL